MKRPDTQAILAPLKPFQRRTVEHAFERLFLAPDSTARFLVADEVGLGKTLVARGIIAKTIDHLWDSVDRIDIIYVCSNGSIARANLPKLQVGHVGERAFALATRLTMLATQLAATADRKGALDHKVNLVSFTPGTSFKMGNSSGKAAEREVLYQLLVPHVPSEKPLMNVLQGNIQDHAKWRRRLRSDDTPIATTIRREFDRRYRKDKGLRLQLEALMDGAFGRARKHLPPESRIARNQFVGQVRQLLAQVCVEALEPDLVILDEFQRFKGLLEKNEEGGDPAAELAQCLFNAVTPEGNPVRTLLLSATPYKLYTSDAELETEDHYQDFLATTRFLMANDEARVDALKSHLAGFGSALRRIASGGAVDVGEAKRKVEQSLRAVMARTERVAASEDRDAMVAEPTVPMEVRAEDVRQYFAADALFRAVDDRDPIAFWKAAPYLIHFMKDYKVNGRLEEALAYAPEDVWDVFKRHAPAFLNRDALNRWAPLEPAHAKLRVLVAEVLDRGLWKLLWMPPTVPYWPLGGAYEGQAGSTKSLLFSAWNFVPDVVSAVLSYETERRMYGGQLEAYKDPNIQQRALLRLTRGKNDVRSRHRLLLLLLPCLPLADQAHPLDAPAGQDRRAWVRARVEALLSAAGLPDPKDGPADDRWEWALPLLLDPGLRGFLVRWRDDPELPRPSPDVFGAYLDDLLELDPATLGRRPDTLVDLATDLALSAPGILAARTLCVGGSSEDVRRQGAVRIAMSFWQLFNRPAVIKLLRQFAAADTETIYWRQVLGYCKDGNLQSVLDEEWHRLWEQNAWASNAAPDEITAACAAAMAEVVQPPQSRVLAKFYKAGRDGVVQQSEMNLRADLALRFGKAETDEKSVSQDAVRAAFNSPFRPFVLTSTSVGQEGLDFHPWCHRLVHWNLPGNPVDLEQREGRVHRYKGHAVRKNVATKWAEQALAAWKPGDDLWTLIFDLADQKAREDGESDLVPYWLAPGIVRVERYVPMLPYTKEVEAFARLKRQLAAYRVVFGQPRQEELVTLLDRAAVDLQQLRGWAVDLSPGGSSDTA